MCLSGERDGDSFAPDMVKQEMKDTKKNAGYKRFNQRLHPAILVLNFLY